MVIRNHLLDANRPEVLGLTADRPQDLRFVLVVGFKQDPEPGHLWQQCAGRDAPRVEFTGEGVAAVRDLAQQHVLGKPLLQRMGWTHGRVPGSTSHQTACLPDRSKPRRPCVPSCARGQRRIPCADCQRPACDSRLGVVLGSRARGRRLARPSGLRE
jgi:hypothetical protein